MGVMICRKCRVRGRVQGVYYRATVAGRARELGVTGYARNLSDGRVEVLACGEPQAVQQLLDWLWIGSSASKVIAVDVCPGSDSESNSIQPPADFTTA